MNELIIKLGEFKGVTNGVYNSFEDKIADLKKQFMNLATYLIYGGHFCCSDRYDLYITSVEFYYHEELENVHNRIIDPIMYHRNKAKWNKKEGKIEIRELPYYKIGTLNPHVSGIDITFECPNKYRASALIRAFVVYDKDKKEFLIEDERSTYVYDYFFDGLTIEKGSLKLEWKESLEDYYHMVSNDIISLKTRKNVFQYDYYKNIIKDGPDAFFKKKSDKPCDRMWRYSRTQKDKFKNIVV